ncbi:MAG TPA: ThiF family adenylyltransferase [Phycisphaerales bacterium]|nr:ThiF family adenylyltransferase [Phycisphaerales bacterium]HRQ75474.1 ThiF family adenylyltransferase [Phycisphaerales bacterium]
MAEASHPLDRYHRQMLLPAIGEAGQQRLAASHALIVGCGALGSVIADSLCRAGVGRLTIVDRDVVERTNLQRQVVFDERDAGSAMPKAEAAKRRLAVVNSSVQIVAHVDDFNARNAERYAEGADILLDGLDNFETRYLLNDLAVKQRIPYVYGGAVGTTGMSFTFMHGGQPCLRCLFPDPPPPGTMATCDTAGVLGPAAGIVALYQSTQAIKLLSGNDEAIDRFMLSIDIWTNELRRFDMRGAQQADCVCCAQRRFEFLDGRAAAGAVSLCGRNAVQINPMMSGNAAQPCLDLHAIAMRLAAHGQFHLSDDMLRGEFRDEKTETGAPMQMMLFSNGRAIITGTPNTDIARSLYARYVGS